MSVQETGIAPETCKECPRWDEVKDRVRINRLLESAITKLEERLKAADFKPTVGDYLKLLQLEKDFEQEEIKEVKVTWVDPKAPSKEK